MKTSPKELFKINKFAFASRLVLARKTKKYTQNYMADSLNVSASTYSDWESPKSSRLPSDPNTLLNICFTLGINCHYLLTGTLITEKDDMALSRMNSFFYRSTHDGEFNTLIRRLEQAPKEVIKSVNTLLEFLPSAKQSKKRKGFLKGKNNID